MATDRFLYGPAQRRALRSMWLQIVATKSGVSAVIADARAPTRVLHFIFGVFVSQERADGYHHLLKPNIAYAMAQDVASGGRAFLDEDEIARENAGAGLHLVVTNFGHVTPDPGTFRTLRAAMYESSRKATSCWNLLSFASEVYGVNWHGEAKEMGAALGFHSRRYTEQQLEDEGVPADKEPFVWLATRRHAVERPAGMTIAMLFLSFAEPKLGLSGEEQRILRLALEGHTDEALAEITRASLSTIKNRFRAIYEKASAANVNVEAGRTSGAAERTRGAETRRRLLNYLRANQSELRPYKKTP